MNPLSDAQLGRLMELSRIISPSMQESEMTDYLCDSWQKAAPGANVRVDAMGNLELSYNVNPDFPTLALVAHADTICVQLTCPAGRGKWRFRSVGCSPHMLLGQPMVVVTESGERVNGVVGFDPTSQFGQPKGLVFEDLWIDIPAGQAAVQPGDLAVLAPRISVEGDMVTGTALDDRLGLFIIGEALRRIAYSDVRVNLICVATVQEEVGLRGSQAFDFIQRPDAAIVLDVDYATDVPASHEDQMGSLLLGHGPGVLKKADNSPALRKFIRDAAASHDIPLQVSLGRFLYGGTDCSSLQVHRAEKGYPVANVTLPLRYMHSPVETASLADMAHAIDLIVAVAEKLWKQA